jgi:hypothetical protein
MAFTEFQIRKCSLLAKEYCEENGPPPHLRSQIRLEYRIKDQSIFIFHVRPSWRDPNEEIEEMAAKTTYVKSQNVWKVFWLRADLKWHRYDPCPKVKNFYEFLDLVKKDQYNCFFG